MASTAIPDFGVIKTVKEKTVKKEAEETLAVWSPGADKLFRVLGAVVTSSVEAVITLLDEAGVVFMVTIPAKTAYNLPASFNYLSVKKGNKLNLKTSAEAVITATVYGTEE